MIFLADDFSFVLVSNFTVKSQSYEFFKSLKLTLRSFRTKPTAFPFSDLRYLQQETLVGEMRLIG